MLNNYNNIKFDKKFFQSSSNQYLKNFIKKIQSKKINILEIHNRPHYINFLKNIKNIKKILFFHNDPLNMQGSVTVKERLKLINETDQII